MIFEIQYSGAQFISKSKGLRHPRSFPVCVYAQLGLLRGLLYVSSKEYYKI